MTFTFNVILKENLHIHWVKVNSTKADKVMFSSFDAFKIPFLNFIKLTLYKYIWYRENRSMYHKIWSNTCHLKSHFWYELSKKEFVFRRKTFLASKFIPQANKNKKCSTIENKNFLSTLCLRFFFFCCCFFLQLNEAYNSNIFLLKKRI